MFVFEERGKPDFQEKNLSEQSVENQQTQPTYDAGPKTRVFAFPKTRVFAKRVMRTSDLEQSKLSC